MTTDEMIAVMTAFKEGKTIQVTDRGYNNWSNTTLPCWDFDTYDYRIKPEPKYRPYESVEEILEDIKKKGFFLNCSSTPLHIISGIYPPSPNNVGTLRVRVNGHTSDVKALLTYCTWPDGTPFGVREE